jgi:lantibiotic biosynthesis protein
LKLAFDHRGWFVLRTPLLPIGILEQWSDSLGAAAVAQDSSRTVEDVAGAMCRDLEILDARLQDVLARPMLREAIAQSSPSLLSEITAGAGAALRWRVQRSLIRFLIRATARPEPFGLLAGWSVGRIGPVSVPEIGSMAGYQRVSRSSVDELEDIANEIRLHAMEAGVSRFYPAAGLYKVRTSWRRVAPPEMDGGITRLDPSDALDVVLARARDGRTLDDLSSSLAELFPDLEVEEASAFVREVVDERLLVSEPCVDPTDEGGVQGLRSALDRLAPSAAVIELARRLDNPQSAACTVDLLKPAPDLSLGAAVVHELSRGVEALHRLQRPRDRGDLDGFRERFADRYGERTVPLVWALDPDTGIGFGTTMGFPDSAPFEEPIPQASVPRSPAWTSIDDLMLRLLDAASRREAPEVVLQDADLSALPPPAASLPPTFLAQAAVEASTADDLNAGSFSIVLKSISLSAAGLLGRLASVAPELRRLCTALARDEQQLFPHALLAEIGTSPSGLRADVTRRPRLYGHRILFGAEPNRGGAEEIPLEDLDVTVQGDSIVLSSRRLGREILPRYSCAVRTIADDNVVFRFLRALQSQAVGGASWSWGPLAGASCRPRVRFGRTVLARASWRVRAEEMPAGIRAPAAPEAFREWRAWADRRQVPRWLSVRSDETELAFDAESAAMVRNFFDMLREERVLDLYEMMPTPGACVFRAGTEGRFFHDILVPFKMSKVLTDAHEQHSGPVRAERTASWSRHGPASFWLFLKLYGGPHTVDELLWKTVAPLMRAVRHQGLARRWFFVRYADPGWHLRVRLEAVDAAAFGELVRSWSGAAGLREDGIWRVQIDTYDPECLRYGGEEGMEIAHAVFDADSDAVLDLLSEEAGRAPRTRWEAALHGVDRLLADFGLVAPEQRAMFLDRCLGAFRGRLAAEPALKKWAAKNSRRELERLAAAESEEAGGADGGAFASRSKRLELPLTELSALARRGLLTRPLAAIHSSFIHMHLNRIFRSLPALHEEILLDVLSRHYRGRAARQS